MKDAGGFPPPSPAFFPPNPPQPLPAGINTESLPCCCFGAGGSGTPLQTTTTITVPLAKPPEHPKTPRDDGTLSRYRAKPRPYRAALAPCGCPVPPLLPSAGISREGRAALPAPTQRSRSARGPAPAGRGTEALSAYNFKELRASRNQEQMAGIGQLQNLP